MMDTKDIKKLIEMAQKADLAEFEYSEGDIKIRIVRGNIQTFQMPSINPTAYLTPSSQSTPQVTNKVDSFSRDDKAGEVDATVAPDNYQQITSPMVGTFYRSPAPDAAPFVDIGSIVEIDQTLCIVEAMKLMNEIKAEFKFKIIEILVENGHAIEFNQPLFKVQKI